MNTFIELNTNPAKVVALYPESVSGRLCVPQDDWIHLFGGPQKAPSRAETTSSSKGHSTESEGLHPARPPSPQGSVAGVLRSGLESLIASARKDDDASSIRSGGGKRLPPPKGPIASFLTV